MRLRRLSKRREGNDPGEREQEFAPNRLVRDQKVIRGKDGWLFLAGDTNEVLAQHTGELRLGDDQLEQWRLVLESRKEGAAALGAAFLFAVAPDNHAIYPEKLPSGIVTVEDRPVRQLGGHLRNRNSSVEMVYPLEELHRAKRDRVVCIKTDTHWNEYGAFLVYQQLADEIDRLVPIRRLTEDDVAFPMVDIVGDLGHKLGQGHIQTPVAFMRHTSASLVADNRVQGIGAVIETECPDAPGTCVVVGDSYAWSLMRFFAESFGHLTFVQMPTFDWDFIARRRPNLIINLIAERFLVTVPDDQKGPPAERHVERKRVEGRDRDPVPFWRMTTRPSMETAERMRVDLLAEGRVRDATIVSLLAHAGLRPPEILSLRWRHVNNGHLEIRRRRLPGRWSRIPVLGPLIDRRRPIEARDVPVWSHLAEDLDRWRQSRNGQTADSEFVFPGSEGGHWQEGEWRAWRDEVYAPLAERCGAGPGWPHDLRHIVSKMLINAGASPDELAEVLGTSSDQVLSQYAEIWYYLSGLPPISIDDQVKLMRERVRAQAE